MRGRVMGMRGYPRKSMMVVSRWFRTKRLDL